MNINNLTDALRYIESLEKENKRLDTELDMIHDRLESASELLEGYEDADLCSSCLRWNHVTGVMVCPDCYNVVCTLCLEEGKSCCVPAADLIKHHLNFDQY